MDRPAIINDSKYRYDSFDNGKALPGKKGGRLPIMGWNSWNAFGSGNSEELTKAMADKIVELGLDKLGYKYLVLDDGCYKNERVDGLLANEEVKFTSGFRALSDYIHARGLKFGMYNDIGTNLCAGAAVGTCGHEMDDARSYVEWGVDFIKVDNCYYPWDNATFSNPENARYTYAPNIKSITLRGSGTTKTYSAVKDGRLTGTVASIVNDEYVTGLGTFDGTGPEHTPVGDMSSELVFEIDDLPQGEYSLIVEYATGKEAGAGQWLQVAVESGEDIQMIYDDFLEETESKDTFTYSPEFGVALSKGKNVIRLMNHRRQENTLCSYAALLEGFEKADPDGDIVLSLCEWGKTQPQNWGYKVGDSWRILNDITFQVGSDGDPGRGSWESDYTTGVAVQYDKAVIMDEFAGLSKGWNDPDMLMIGMDGLDMTMCQTHFTMWSMMNSPLMLGLDFRRIHKGDEIYDIIANSDVIALNQDSLGIQAKRVYTTLGSAHPDTEYIRDNERVDVLAKPLSDGSLAVSFINLSKEDHESEVVIDIDTILSYIGNKMTDKESFERADRFEVTDLWSKEKVVISERVLKAADIKAHGNKTIKVKVV
ncbi:MAG: alpha-galactosidase [Butyrivibrio sp.]|nr:alpha-galactosidase [Butyrivibrio sp.]